MRISKKAEYALRALVAMARGPQWIQIQELSRRERIPVKFLEQIMLTLRHGGLLTSKRGVGGGYSLRANPSEITLADVIAIVDGPLAPMPCAAEKPVEQCTCPVPASCPIRLAMIEVREEIASALGRRTIADVVRLTPDPAKTLAFEI
jgi:Rrf2 family protein